MKLSTPLSFICSMPYFPHSAACTRNITHVTQLPAPSAPHSFPKSLIYSNRLWFIHPTVLIGSFSPLSSCRLELRVTHMYSVQMYISHQSCWYFIHADTRGILKASGKLSLRFRHSFYIEELVPLLE